MTAPDPDAVQVLARVLHTVYCLPGARPGHRWSQRHEQQDETRARQVVTRFKAAGLNDF